MYVSTSTHFQRKIYKANKDMLGALDGKKKCPYDYIPQGPIAVVLNPGWATLASPREVKPLLRF